MINKQYFCRVIPSDKDGTPCYTTETNIPDFAEDIRSKLEKLAEDTLKKLDETKHMEQLSVEIKFFYTFE
jgi:hypothetical protein